MRIRINGGRVIDPGNLDGTFDILIENGVIVKIVESGGNAGDFADAKIIDAAGLIVTPGLVDMHVHLREPGHEYKETIETGCRAAVAGGFTAVCAMPNTDPVNDNSQITKTIIRKAKEAGLAKVYPVAAVSRGLSGETMSEFADLKQAGVVAFTDDGMPVTNSLLMRRAMEYAKGFGLPIISHCEEMTLAAGGAANEGPVATRMGLAGIPNAAESIMVMRDIALARLTGAHVHIAHVSTAESVAAIREAKAEGVTVTAETAPHYFSLTDEAIEGYDTHAKMNPPLRSSQDRDAIRTGLADGTLDAIATDHAPHSSMEKDLEFDRAANGVIGLETSLPVSLRLVEEGVLSLTQLIEKMSVNPARSIGISTGLKPGAAADLTIIDTHNVHTIRAAEFYSKSRNTPFEGWEIKGRAVATIVDGRAVFQNGALV